MKNIFLKVEHLYHFFGNKCVLYDINFDIAEGQFFSLVGPSGCGKTTLLKAMVGTHPPTRGKSFVFSRSQGGLKEITKPGRDIGIVYQGYPLFPYLTALKNVAIGLMIDETTIPGRALRYIPRYNKRRNIRINWAELRKLHLEEAAEWLRKLKLGDAMDKYPQQLSGGMRQRVAIAQTLIMKPKVTLLDEPFSALDQETKEELLEIIEELRQENIQAVRSGQEPLYTIGIVTHELDAAILVGDRVIGLSPWWDYTKEKDPCAKGASTIIYDKSSKVFLPDKYQQAREFADQEEEVYKVVINNKVLLPREDYVRFWEQYQKGDVVGVLKEEQKDENAEQSGNKKGGVS